MKHRCFLFLLFSLISLCGFAAKSTDDCRELSIYQIMSAAFQRVETGVPGFTDMWGPEGHRTDGNIKGITASLDHIKGLGFNAIWLTPIFDTTNGLGGEKLQATGYFATDYFNIDPRFGTKEDFRELVNEAHRRGIHIILDLVAGHHGGNPAPSPSGLTICTEENTPNDLNFLQGNIKYPESLPFFKEVIRYWMDEFGVDGWRLDQCYQVCQGGHNYWKELREEAQAVASERKARGEEWGTLAYMVGEDWNEPDNIITTRQDGLKSVFDFERRNSLLWLSNGLHDIIRAYTDPCLRGYGKDVMPNLFVGNHDMERIGSYLPDVRQLLFRYAVLAAYSGPVTFFYGDEFGLKDGEGNSNDRSRVSGRLTAETSEEQWLCDMTARLFRIRASHPAMWRGQCSFMLQDGALDIVKTDPFTGERIVIIMPVEDCQRNFPANTVDLLTDRDLGGTQQIAAYAPVIYTLPAIDTDMFGNMPQSSTGTIHRYIFNAPGLDDLYTVDVWMPLDYDASRDAPYPVIYAQDGQNLFDPSVTWNHQAWEMDNTICSLGDAIVTPIVVGIHNNSTRAADYLPHKPLAGNSELENKIITLWGQEESRSDRYLDFIVNIVKPNIEQAYNVRKDFRGNTIMGSSMGGLISLYAMCEYPSVFGGALCLSTHWIGFDYTTVPDFPEAMLGYVSEALPRDGLHKLYLDHGTLNFDSQYEPWDTKAYDTAIRNGYRDGVTVMHYIDEGGDHNESSWAARLSGPLTFALGTGNPLLTPEDTSIYLYYEGAGANDTFYTFVYTGAGDNNSAWPGVEMECNESMTVNGTSGPWFVYKVPEALSIDGLAMVTDNGARRYPADMEPGIPLRGQSLAFIYKNGGWTTEPVENVSASGITDIVIDSDAFSPGKTEIYTLQGRRIDGGIESLPCGIYIIRRSGRTFKLMK